MTGADAGVHDPVLYGADDTPGLVAVEHLERAGGDLMALYRRRGRSVSVSREPFESFIVCSAEALAAGGGAPRVERLDGGGPLNRLALFPTWKARRRALRRMSEETGFTAGTPQSPYWSPNDPVQQFLMRSGHTLMLGLAFEDLERMQVDIECATSEGYTFCNPERDGDRIIAIGLGDGRGWTTVLSGADLDEKGLLERFAELVAERDPDVLEGHNIFNFDLPYLFCRAERLGVRLGLGRDGSVPARRASRFSVGDRTMSYERFSIRGRHVVDTLFLVQAYDAVHRVLSGYGLKEAAAHFGLSAPERTFIPGHRIGETFARDPGTVCRYVQDDVAETRGLAEVLSRSVFLQARMLPFSYQTVCVRGAAAKIDALMIREYLRQGRALPRPDVPRAFAGGYTDLFAEGVVRDVHHVDVRSLYPSLMLARRIRPGTDELDVFLNLLDRLRTVRLDAKRAMDRARRGERRRYYAALQGAFKILINAFYGYLGFAQARFSDFGAAEQVTQAGRNLLVCMIDWLKAHGAQPVEIDTDGIYFVPPRTGGREAFRSAFRKALPEGIEVEFDGEYEAMFSYKMKNYALLTPDGELVVKGGALRSRGLEPFQRDFLEDLLRLRLEGREGELPALKARYETALREGNWPVEKFAKTETLQESPDAYAAKVGAGKCGRRAAYELALASERDYRAGDQVAYYVTGETRRVAVHEKAKLAADWNPAQRDENTAYYLAKLDALYRKFAPESANQEELAL